MRPLLALLLLIPSQALSAWVLDNNDSRLNFVTIKATDVAEVHRFQQLSGQVDDSGRAEVTISLASVDTLIPIRDERMREVLFRTDVMPTAKASTRIDLSAVQDLPTGGDTVVTSEVVLSLGDVALPIVAELRVLKIADNRVQVATAKPLIVNAATVGLAEGVEVLRDIAGLPSISKAVPVTFVLTFTSAGR